MTDVIDTDDLRKNMAANVLRLREQKGMSQDELAAKLGISRIHLSRIENAHASPSAELLFTLSDVLNVPSDTFRQTCEKIAG